MDTKELYEMHAEICKIFTHPKRLEIINLLRDSEKSVGELVELSDIPQPNLSQHLAILRQRGIVSTRHEGINVFYSISNPKILKACDTMREVLLEQLTQKAKIAEEALN
ncbi:MAG: metalloregulator ArsR/SmtB family transcription factor [Candidatus Hydrothermarchaeales archaeon]